MKPRSKSPARSIPKARTKTKPEGNGKSGSPTRRRGKAAPEARTDGADRGVSLVPEGLESPDDGGIESIAEILPPARDGEEVDLTADLAVLGEDGADGLVEEAVETETKPSAGALVKLDPMSQYLAEIRGYPPLDRTEEQRLARQVRDTGDPEAAAKLIKANLLLVVKISRLFRRAVTNALDLIQEGNVGLIQALDRYDPEVGVRFSTYAAFWIKAYILKYLLDNVRMVRVGTTNARRKLLYNLHREKRSLEAAGFSAGPRLLAEKFGVSEKDVVEIEQTLAGGDVSLDAQVGDDESRTRGDVFASTEPSVEDQVARSELKDLVEGALTRFRRDLPSRDAEILDRRLLADEPATLQEIGDRFGITREAVRQAEKRLTDKLRAYLSTELGEEAVLQFQRRR